MKSEAIEANTLNAAALGMSIANVETVLTILVLITALIYNLKRIFPSEDET